MQVLCSAIRRKESRCQGKQEDSQEKLIDGAKVNDHLTREQVSRKGDLKQTKKCVLSFYVCFWVARELTSEYGAWGTCSYPGCHGGEYGPEAELLIQCAVRAVLWHRIMVIISTAGACCCQNWSLIVWYLLLNVYLLRNSTLHDIKVRCKVVFHLVSFHCLIKVSELRLLGYVLFSGKLLVVVFVVCTVAACSFQTHSSNEQTAECFTPTYTLADFC